MAIGGTFTIDRVCVDCNSWLGANVDAALTDHLMIVVRRWQLGLAGNSGAVPDGIRAVLGKGVLASDPTRRFVLETNPETGKLEHRGLYHSKEITREDGTRIKQIMIDAKDAGQIGTILQRERKRAGVPPLSSEELEKEVSQILSQGVQTLERPELRHEIAVDIAQYRRAIFKIAYELACTWIGNGYLEDPVAAKLRNVVLGQLDEKDAGLSGQINLGVDLAPLMLWSADAESHIAFVTVTGSSLVIFIRIFDSFSALIEASRQAEQYAHGQLDPAVVRFVGINPVSGKVRESSFLDEIGRLVRSRQE